MSSQLQMRAKSPIARHGYREIRHSAAIRHGWLDSAGAHVIAELMVNAVAIEDMSGFDQWCQREVCRLIPFDGLMCMVGWLHGDQLVIETVHTIGCGREKPERSGPGAEEELFRQWLKFNGPQVASMTSMDGDEPPSAGCAASSPASHHIAAHGVVGVDGLSGSCFLFSGLKPPLAEDLELRLDLAVPCLHQTFFRISPWKSLASRAVEGRFTARELQLLQGLMHGMTNEQIASLVYRSPHTVKHQIAAIMRKLGATSRAQAVAKAMSLGLTSVPQKVG